MDLLTLIILISASVAVGFFAATLIRNNRTETDLPTPAVEDRVVDDGRVEVFRLWRRKGERGVVPEIQNRLVEAADELTPEEHADVSLALVDLYTWLEQSNHTAISFTAAGSTLAPTGKNSSTETDTPSTNPGKQLSSETKPPSLNIFKSLVKSTQTEIKQKVQEDPQSIAEQVDEILQAKLEAMKLDGKAVRLFDLPNQGMVIMVGLEKYRDLNDVPDDELRGLIRDSVAEWEKRMLGNS
jgi:hypothetical protein